jgi:hypothetical protein
MDAATMYLIEAASYADICPTKVAESTVAMPFAILFGVCRPGAEYKLALETTKMVVDAATEIGKDAARAAKATGYSGSFVPADVPAEPYDGPLKQEDIPENVRAFFDKFFETKKE